MLGVDWWGQKGRDEMQGQRIRSFKELVVWQEAMAVAKVVYALTAAFPREERYGLTAQPRRSVVSVPSNIAEGQARGHRAEYRQFLYVALGSLAEAETQLLLAKDLEMTTAIEVVIGQIGQLRQKLLRLARAL